MSMQKTKSHLFISIFLLFFFISGFLIQIKAEKKITKPQDYFGFKLGADRKIARWDKIIDYFKLMEKESDKIKVINMGPSTMGNPFIVLLISSAENLADLKELQRINRQISNPRGLNAEDIKKLVKKGKAVICQSMSLHATEIGGTQMSAQLVFELLSRKDRDAKRILDNVLFFMIPSFNPDGQIMVTDWYRKYVGTKYEGSSLPWLYHKYTGHDNNRDGDFLNMIESVYAAKIMYQEWPPQAYIDHHHMGSYGARFYVPPYCEPIRPFADPLIWREISWYGSHIAYKLEEEGKAGILNSAQFSGWGHFGWHWITIFHNISGMLTESASAKLATPIYIHPEQLRAKTRQFPVYEAQSTFPNPWKGGWWRLSDIVEQKLISALSLLDLAAKNKETVLWNAYLKAKRQTERGKSGVIKGLIISTEQHDLQTAKKMINILLKSGIEIKKSLIPVQVSNRTYPTGSYYISLAQPKMGLIRNLLTQTFYSDSPWTRNNSGAPLRPYDLATHTMNEFMGINADPVKDKVKGEFQIIKNDEPLVGKVKGNSKLYRINSRLNDSYRTVNLLLDKGILVKRVDEDSHELKRGDFLVSNGSKILFSDIAKRTGVNFIPVREKNNGKMHTVKRMRTAMYQRFYGGNMDEGWTRFLLEKFNFPYKTIKDEIIKKGNLNKNYDLIILPSDSTGLITGELDPKRERYFSSNYPPQYNSGIGKVGVKNLIKFVKNGGRLVTLGGSCRFAIDKFDLKVRDNLKNLKSTTFFCPGSTLKVSFDNKNLLAYGMPDEGLLLFYRGMALEVIAGNHNEDYTSIVRYKDKNILQSGWLIGEKKITNRSAVISAKYGKGSVILMACRPQHRFQTHATFKLLFNSIIQ